MLLTVVVSIFLKASWVYTCLITDKVMIITLDASGIAVNSRLGFDVLTSTSLCYLA